MRLTAPSPPNKQDGLTGPALSFAMFASLASFLPTALRDTPRTPSFSPDNDEQAARPETQLLAPPEDQPDPPPQPKKEKERRHANEVSHFECPLDITKARIGFHSR